MGKIKFTVAQGGIGTPLPGQDHYSAFLFDADVLPSGFGANDRIKKVLSLAAAEALGITDSHSDETKATGGQVLITAPGAATEIQSIYITPANGARTRLGSYVVQSGDAAADVASGLVTAINLLTSIHGYVATLNTATVQLTAPAKQGAAINASGLAFETLLSTGSAGTGTATVMQFSGGVGSQVAPMHYHVSEFFRMQPGGVLWIGIYDFSSAYDAAKIKSVQDYAEGQVRNFGVYLQNTYAASFITSSQTVVDGLFLEDKQVDNVYIAADLSATTISALTNLTTLDSENVALVLLEDGGGEGYRLAGVTGKSITSLGCVLGVKAFANVHENCGWVGKFNLAGFNSSYLTTENDIIAFATGELYSNQPVSVIGDTNTPSLLTTYGYHWAKKYVGITGSFLDTTPTCTLASSDFARTERNSVMNKAIRLVRTKETPLVNSPLYVDASTGKLDFATIQTFKNAAFEALEQMARDGEINTNTDGTLPAASVVIDPDQDVITNAEIQITINIVPVGTAETISNTIGFKTQLS